MNSILQTLKELPKKLYEIDLSGKNIGEFLEECQSTFDEFILTYARQRIEELDKAIVSSREERENWKVVKSHVPRALETRHGLLEYSRRYYRNSESKEYSYLTDLALGVVPYQRVEDGLQLSLAEAASRMSYREASKLACEDRVSASSVMNIIRRLEIPEQEPKKKKKRVEQLHIQADEDHVYLQSQHRKSGQIRFAAIHEPKIKVGQSRYALPERQIISSVREKPSDFGERVLDRLDAFYELEHVERIYVHGDGAPWIKTLKNSLPRKITIPILDHFHLEKELLEVCRGDRRLRSMLRTCLHPWDNERLEKELQMLVDSDVCTQEKASKLWTYLQNNRQGIENNFTLEHGGSCAEGLVSHVFSRRFSRDPLSWSYQGLEKLSAIRVHLENGNTLDRSMLRENKRVDKEEFTPILSAAQSKITSKNKKETQNWSVRVPGSELSSGAIGAIIRGINKGGYIC